eukprot:scaffold251632_cov14-Tisochrysis_lutea.AAC.1
MQVLILRPIFEVALANKESEHCFEVKIKDGGLRGAPPLLFVQPGLAVPPLKWHSQTQCSRFMLRTHIVGVQRACWQAGYCDLRELPYLQCVKKRGVDAVAHSNKQFGWRF